MESVKDNTEQSLSDVVRHWGLSLKRIHHDITIAGSPERCIFRTVFEDDDSAKYVLEEIAAPAAAHKTEIAGILRYLFEQGLFAIRPYLINSQGSSITTCFDRHWQLVPFIEGSALARPQYVSEGLRGRALGDFLIAFRQKARDIPFGDVHQPFSIKRFIRELMAKIGHYEPDLLLRIGHLSAFLDREFMAIHDDIPVIFCHGDYHPLNVIWGKDHIRAVIDWEFCGFKPEVYDLAILIACIGIEEPSGLTGFLVESLLDRFRQAREISEVGIRFLLEFVVASRFAWLSEWLRKADREMVEMEMDYMTLLVEQAAGLRRAWHLPS